MLKQKKKKQRRGFTLVELLAVIVILAIILAIAVPTISALIQDAKEKAFAANAKLLIKAIDYKKLEDSTFDPTTLTKENAGSILGIDTSNVSSLTVTMVNGKPSVSIAGTNKYENITATGTFDSIAVIDTPVYTDYSVSEGVNVPKLATGMTAVKWDASNNEMATTASDPDWYDYGSKKWANAKTQDGSYWVWIPRYAYRITSGFHSNVTGTIDVKFLTDTSNTAADSTSVVAYSNGNSATNFVPHPAFNFGGTQVTGMWVAKFEASNNGGKVASKPNMNSWNNFFLSDAYNASRNMETNSAYGWGTSGSNLDTHMIKNTEWGAVAYLATSNYGKVSEVWINNLNTNLAVEGFGPSITGCAGSSVSAAELKSTTCPAANQYNTATGVNASTTGNITGIYDMVGGNEEYVMGNINNSATFSGLTPSTIPDKYIDRYSSGVTFGYNNSYYGDAYFETSGNAYSWIDSTIYNQMYYSWNGDSSFIPNDTNPWFARGGFYTSYTGGTKAGLFSFISGDGYQHGAAGFRSSFMVHSGL